MYLCMSGYLLPLDELKTFTAYVGKVKELVAAILSTKEEEITQFSSIRNLIATYTGYPSGYMLYRC